MEILNQKFQLEDPSDWRKLFTVFLKNYISPNTQKAYIQALKNFILYLKNSFPNIHSPKQIEKLHILAYRDQCLKEMKSRQSINLHLTALSVFFNFLIKKNIVEQNPLQGIQRYKMPKEVMTLDLSDKEVQKLLDSINGSKISGAMHKALLSAYFFTGMRHTEITSLKFEQIITLNSETWAFKYKAKGGRERTMPLHPVLKSNLADYIYLLKSEGRELNDKSYVFQPTRNPLNEDLDKQLDPKSVRWILKKYAKIAGIENKITIHSARSTVIGHLLQKGLSLHQVAEFVGHSSINMTKAYSKRKMDLEVLKHLDYFDEGLFKEEK